MSLHRFIVYADLSCPFCYTLHERLLELGYMSQVDWRSIEHEPSAKFDPSALHTLSELTDEVNHIREVAPEVNVIIPPGRPNSRFAIEMVSQAYQTDTEKAITFRTLVYRALWQNGEDIGDESLIEKLRIEAGLPELKLSDDIADKITLWKKEWTDGDFSRNIPAILTDTGNKILGLPSVEVIDASLHDTDADDFEEGAFCHLKPKEKILIASNNDAYIDKLIEALDKSFQIEIAQSGELVYESCLQSNSPDLVLMDIALEGVDGYETCLQLKDTAETQNISIILFSNEIDSDQEVKAFDVGANDFIITSCPKEVIKARIRVLLRLKRTTDLLEQFSRMDSLTEIPNRREFDRTLEKEWLRAKRARSELSLILLDIDYFKKYNDHYGHLEGDQCLKDVAQVIEKNIRRAHDTVARYGGEEFVVILPDTDKDGAIKVANQIITGLKNKNLQHEKSEIEKRITVSLGISTVVPESPLNPKNLVDSADVALYAAKDSGRNRFMYNQLQEKSRLIYKSD